MGSTVFFRGVPPSTTTETFRTLIGELLTTTNGIKPRNVRVTLDKHTSNLRIPGNQVGFVNFDSPATASLARDAIRTTLNSLKQGETMVVADIDCSHLSCVSQLKKSKRHNAGKPEQSTDTTKQSSSDSSSSSPPSSPMLVIDLFVDSLSVEIPESTPSYFCCPITTEIFNDPVVAADGYTYEREAILSFFQEYGTISPVQRVWMPSDRLIPNLCLRRYLDAEKKRRAMT